MGKRRTRKQKVKARNNFKGFYWTEAKNPEVEANVNRQIEKTLNVGLAERHTANNAEQLAQQGYLGSVKKDITKSVIIASLILGIELVLYLAWH
jgi:hypothetical protein